MVSPSLLGIVVRQLYSTANPAKSLPRPIVVARLQVGRIVERPNMQRDLAGRCVIGKAEWRSAAGAKSPLGDRRGPAISWRRIDPGDALRRHPGQNSEGAAGRSPAHVAMAVMHSRLASDAKADRAGETSSAQFHVGVPADLRPPSRSFMRVAPFISAETPLICVGSWAVSGTSPGTWRCVSLLRSCHGHILPVGDALISMPSLAYGPLGDRCMHVCVDMQRLFAEPSQWATPWITRVLPQIERLVERRAPQTVFTRFLPARKAGQGVGTWKRSYERWASMTIEIGPEMAELLPSLAGYCPPAAIIDKHIYSPWFEGSLRALLMARDTGHHGWRNRCMRSGHSARGHRFRLSRGSGYGRAVQLFRRNPRRAADRLSSAVRATGRDSRDGDRSIQLDVNPPCRQGLKLTRPDR